MITRDSIISHAKDQVFADLAGEAAILNLTDGVYYGLDRVGASIWNMLERPRSVAEIRDGVMALYDVGAEECERDLMVLLNELAARGLVNVTQPDGTP